VKNKKEHIMAKAKKAKKAKKEEVKEEVNLEQGEPSQVVSSADGPLKQMLVDYVGSVMQPENGEVTVEMIVQAMASEFPDFLLVVAKENWIRGYQQAMFDVENIEKEGEFEGQVEQTA
jgi:aspartate/methionine/tyrosine aminotransferase